MADAGYSAWNSALVDVVVSYSWQRHAFAGSYNETSGKRKVSFADSFAPVAVGDYIPIPDSISSALPLPVVVCIANRFCVLFKK